MISLVVLLLVHVTLPQATASRAATRPAATPQFPVQLGARITPDTVTVGQRFVVLLKVRGPAGSTIQFPVGVDSVVAASPTAPQVIGSPLIDSVADATGTTRTAAYRFTAWDTGAQQLGLGNIAVTLNGRTEYVSLARQVVFVRPVLPADTTLQKPKPPRSPIVLAPFNWWPWIALLVAVLLALITYWVWRAYRRRRDRPLPPFETAEREFARIEAMHLIEAGEPEHHVALMTDVLRTYLAASVEGIQRSQTTPELIAAAAPIHAYASGLARILSEADLVKFARQRVSPSEGQAAGAEARAITRRVEDHFLEMDKEKTEKRAA